MNLSQTYGNMALTLHDNGYTPIPIKPSSKQPMISNWTELKNEFETINKLSKQYSNAGVGILLNELIVFDIDVLDADLCLKVKSIITSHLGETIERIGKFPKRALFYKREGDEFKKQTSKAYTFSNGKAQLEVLAKGNQCIVYGVHPDTRKPYHWVGKSVVDVPLESLPTVSLKTVKSIISEVDILLSSQPNLKPQTKPISQKVLTSYKNEPISQDGKMIISAIRYIDPEDYDTWINVGFALKRHSISNGFNTFNNWSQYKLDGSLCPNYKGEDYTRNKWNTFNPEIINKRTIFELANQNGWRGNGIFEIESNTNTSVAKYLKKQFELDGPVPIYDEGELWKYDGVQWKVFLDNELRQLVHNLDQKKTITGKVIQASKQFVDGCLFELMSMCANPGFFEKQPIGVNCQNGFLQITKKTEPKLLKHDPNHRQRFVIQANWNPHNKEVISGYLKTLLIGCFADEQEVVRIQFIRLIRQILGVAVCGISTKLSNPICFVLYGPSASNGKSQILELIRSLLPKKSCCTIPPADLGKEQYLIELVGKMANLSDELSGANAIKSDKLKAVITGDTVSGKRVYKPVCSFKPNAIHIFATNVLPNFKGGIDAGINRRVKVIPFNRAIPKKERIPRIAEKIISNEKDQLLNFAISGAMDVVNNDGYMIPENVNETTQQWFEDSDIIVFWFSESNLHKLCEVNSKVTLTDAYLSFRSDAESLGEKLFIPTRTRFSQQIRQLVNSDIELEIARDKKSNFIRQRKLV